MQLKHANDTEMFFTKGKNLLYLFNRLNVTERFKRAVKRVFQFEEVYFRESMMVPMEKFLFLQYANSTD